MNETPLLHKFIERVPYTIPDARVYRRNIINVLAKGRKGGTFRAKNGITGQADAYAIIRGGFIIELEAKAHEGVLSDAQLRWQAFCLEFEIPHLVLRAEKDEAPDATVSRWIAELARVVRELKEAA